LRWFCLAVAQNITKGEISSNKVLDPFLSNNGDIHVQYNKLAKSGREDQFQELKRIIEGHLKEESAASNSQKGMEEIVMPLL